MFRTVAMFVINLHAVFLVVCEDVLTQVLTKYHIPCSECPSVVKAKMKVKENSHARHLVIVDSTKILP